MFTDRPKNFHTRNLLRLELGVQLYRAVHEPSGQLVLLGAPLGRFLMGDMP